MSREFTVPYRWSTAPLLHPLCILTSSILLRRRLRLLLLLPEGLDERQLQANRQAIMQQPTATSRARPNSLIELHSYQGCN